MYTVDLVVLLGDEPLLASQAASDLDALDKLHLE